MTNNQDQINELEEKAFTLIKRGIFPEEIPPDPSKFERESTYLFRDGEYYFSEESEYRFPTLSEKEKINYLACKSLRFSNVLIHWLRRFDGISLPLLNKLKEEIEKNVNEYKTRYGKEGKTLLKEKLKELNPKRISFKNLTLLIFPILCEFKSSEETLTGEMIFQQEYNIDWKIEDIKLSPLLKKSYNDFILKVIKNYYNKMIKTTIWYKEA